MPPLPRMARDPSLMNDDPVARRTTRLVAALGSPDGDVRFLSYEKLLGIGAAALPFIHEGLKHENWQVRRWCAMILDRMANAESLRRLVPLLDDPHRLVRLWAVHSIACDQCKGGNNPLDVEPLLIQRMRSDRSVRVRRMAAAMLANHHYGSRALRAFRKLLEEPEEIDDKVRLHAELGLQRVED